MRGSSPSPVSDPSSATTKPPAGSNCTTANGSTDAAARRPSSSRRPSTPLPAAVPIVPSPNTRHTRAPHQSPTSTLPSAATATERGQTAAATTRRASPPSSTMPLPATVSIRPPGATRRTRRFSKSANTIAPSATTATLHRTTQARQRHRDRHRPEKPPSESESPTMRDEPASVEIVPSGATRRSRVAALGDHEPAGRRRRQREQTPSCADRCGSSRLHLVGTVDEVGRASPGRVRPWWSRSKLYWCR